MTLVRSPLHDEAGAHRMGVVEAVGAVALDAVDEGAAIDVRRDAVEDQVADRVGHEMDAAVAGEIGELEIEVVDRFLQATTS